MSRLRRKRGESPPEVRLITRGERFDFTKAPCALPVEGKSQQEVKKAFVEFDNIYFAPKGGKDKAMDTCRTCPFIQPCLQRSFTADGDFDDLDEANFASYGTWGGRSYAERRAIYKDDGIFTKVSSAAQQNLYRMYVDENAYPAYIAMTLGLPYITVTQRINDIEEQRNAESREAVLADC